MPLTVDQSLDEFKILRLLGTGGFGAVYLAEDMALNRHVAIKELHEGALLDESLRQRFLQEAQVVSNLNHPNIITVHRLLQQGATQYLIFEYVAGGSLREALNQQGPLPKAQALQLTIEICAALDAVHAKGVIHRDIKPENILLTADGHVKVTDFGIAHVPREVGGQGLTQTGTAVGTGLYMSPEQLRGDKLTSASDVYQVAAMLYEMLTGRHYLDPDALLQQTMRELNVTNSNSPLVQGRWMMVLWQKILTQQFTLAVTTCPEVQPILEDVLCRPPEQRLTTQGLAEKLQSALRERPNTMALTLAESLPLELVRVPAGYFLMGSTSRDTHAESDEKPQHKLFLEDYYISRYPVTNAQYQVFVQATGYRPPLRWKQKAPLPGEEQHPVSHVTWDDALAFCEWLRVTQQCDARLPTEAEWEKAARGPTGRFYPWGNKPPTPAHCDISNAQPFGYGPVGQHPRGDSPYGCADLARNVAEWTSSLLRPYPYDAEDGREDVKSRNKRVVRGGGGRLTANGNTTRAAARRAESRESRNWFVGFRVVITEAH